LGREATTDLKALALTMLVFIGIGIVAVIIIQILFHIFFSVGVAISESVSGAISNRTTDDKTIDRRIKAEMKEDERDKIFELKSSRIGSVFVGAGFIVSLLLLANGYPPAVMLHLLFLSFCLSSLFEGFYQLYLYKTTS